MSQFMVELMWDKTDTMTATIIGGERPKIINLI